MKKFSVFLFAIMLFFSSVIVYGQAVMVSQTITVNQARTLPHDSFVILSGNIVNMLSGGTNYTFRDSSGDIIVEIGAKHWRGLSVGVSDTVVIFGEVKINRGLVSIKAHAISGTGRVNTRPGQAVFINRPITIAEAVTLPHDSFIILNGNIINSQARRDDYTFRDSSGDITVEIGSKHWRGLAIGISDRIEIFGEVKINRGIVTIKVHALRLI